MSTRALLDRTRPHDPRSFGFLVEQEFAELEDDALGYLRFLACRLDDATDVDTQGFYAGLLRDSVREVRRCKMISLIGRQFDAHILPLVPEAPAASPYSQHEARLISVTVDMEVSRGLARSLTGSALADLLRERMLGLRGRPPR